GTHAPHKSTLGMCTRCALRRSRRSNRLDRADGLVAGWNHSNCESRRRCTPGGSVSPRGNVTQTPTRTERSGTDEDARMSAVHGYELLDSPPEGIFDEITALAAYLLRVPIALVTVVDSDRIWFASHYG